MGEKKPVVLFVCVHNSSRSQMAEALLRYYGKDTDGNEIVDVRSCGTHAAPKTHKLAKTVMKEINMFTGKPKLESAPEIGTVDYVISLCEADCAAVRVDKQENAVSVSWQIADPSKIVGISEAEQAKAFRETRDKLKTRVKDLVCLLRSPGWSEKGQKYRARSLLKIHDKQLLDEFVKSFSATGDRHSDEHKPPVDPTVKYLLKHMKVSQLWKVGGALAALAITAFSLGLFICEIGKVLS